MNFKEEQLPKTKAENGIPYILDERTQTYLPDWEMKEEYPIKKWGKARGEYLKTYRKATYSELLMLNQLNEHLHSVDEQAMKIIEQTVEAMAKADGLTEEIRAYTNIGNF